MAHIWTNFIFTSNCLPLTKQWNANKWVIPWEKGPLTCRISEFQGIFKCSIGPEMLPFVPVGLQPPLVSYNWASSRENLSSGFATTVDSNRPAQPQKLYRGLKFRIWKLEVLYYLGSEQQRCWSDCADAQADLHLCCAHYGKTRFSHDMAHTYCVCK